ncbi:glyoxalase/bleomycin resistance/extradiol dioxygenase family protein [Winogradskyella forsetii]|uniref:glyoxalase/bleomycin resistance/extradiol dioxygenase family protein n=1 Tax=Winogradskyella forsetii TaxID=2686077 RepID=UPI0015BD5745|nr:glyoxalase/bleomycin resistance/extradiol dioxygenase family protein [Winogradskyella forsetii]
MKINLLVIRTSNPDKLKIQYEKIGFQFNYHQHGNGSLHYASEKEGFVFEIYPLSKSMKEADNSIRLGIEVGNLKLTFRNIENSDWKIISEISKTEWGEIAILQDSDGRKIELKNKM